MRPFPLSAKKEFQVFRTLTSPAKIQNFLDDLQINFEKNGDTCASPLTVLHTRKAHCIEGALLAASALSYHDARPLLLDLKTTRDDSDHVVALFKQHDRWGAISKTNHAVLRWRDPIYRSVRELALSYFHEYFLDSGKKTLRSFSQPFSLLAFEDAWLTSPDNLWPVAETLDISPHYRIIPKNLERFLSPAHPTEIQAGKIIQWKR